VTCQEGACGELEWPPAADGGANLLGWDKMAHERAKTRERI